MLSSWKNSWQRRGSQTIHADVFDKPLTECVEGKQGIVGTDQSDGVGEGTAQHVASLSELHSQNVAVKHLHLQRLVFPAPLLMGDAHWQRKTRQVNVFGFPLLKPLYLQKLNLDQVTIYIGPTLCLRYAFS